MLKDLILKCRSYRRFWQNVTISTSELEDMIDHARLCSSAGNAQALKFKIVNTPEECAKVFPTLTWAKALKDWDGPQEGERPSAYIIIACDLSLGRNKQWDDGITSMAIMLSAAEKGYGGCIFGSVQRSQLAQVVGLDLNTYSLDLVLALGKPREDVVIVPIEPGEPIDYYRDEQQVHYVPKRQLKDILL